MWHVAPIVIRFFWVLEQNDPHGNTLGRVFPNRLELVQSTSSNWTARPFQGFFDAISLFHHLMI